MDKAFQLDPRPRVLIHKQDMHQRSNRLFVAITASFCCHSLLPMHASPRVSPANQKEMDIYTKIAGINSCLYISQGVVPDKAYAIAGETLAQIIRGKHGSRILSIGSRELSPEELRRGSINTAVLSSAKICPESLPSRIKENIAKATRPARDSKTSQETEANNRIQKIPPNERQVLTGETGDEARGREAINEDKLRSYAKLLTEVTVRVEGAGPAGSGVIVNQSGQKVNVLTACHVIADTHSNEEIYVITSDNYRHKAKRSQGEPPPLNDLCRLEFNSTSQYTSISLESAVKLSVGDPILISGWALPTKDSGSSFRLVSGFISSTDNKLNPDGYSLIYITSAPTLPGMSGGPIISHGKLIGMHGRVERAIVINKEDKDVASTYGMGVPVFMPPKN